MDVLEAIKKRRSIRKFNSLKRVSEEQIEKLLDAARWAPSAGNLQSYFFFVVREQAIKDQLVEAALGQEEVAKASVVFVACADLERSAAKYGRRGRGLFALQDATLATYAMWLTVTEMGLGAVWIGAFEEGEVTSILQLSSSFRPVAMLAVGYPAENPVPPLRRVVSEISREI